MEKTGLVKHKQEALDYVTEIEDPITQRLLRMALVHFLLPRSDDLQKQPTCDVDLRYVMLVLHEFLSEHTVLMLTLQGVQIGDFSDDGE
jgi:hypothetical protein